MALKRRDFLKLGGGASLSLPLVNCVSEKTYKSISKSEWFAAIEHWTPSICQACPGGCGLLVRVVDDRAVKIEGNPFHPLNRGKVCAKGQAGLQFLYSPNRIKSPLKRKGERGSGDWEAMSWDEALETLSSELLKLRNSGQSHTVAFIGEKFGNTTDDLISRFLQVYGSPNYLMFDEWLPQKKMYHQTQGISDLLAYDLENTKYVLSFGAAFLTNWPNSMENQRIYGEKRARRDLKILQIEPRFSLEASRSDTWIPLKPGTEGLLALGIASVLVKENLYNEAFINKFTSQFETLRNFLVREIRLDQISDMTGVPLRSIIEIAKEFASVKPAIAIADYNLAFQENGIFNLQAVHSLNALVGNIDSQGGILRQRSAPLGEMPPAVLDEAARSAFSEKRIGESFGDNNLTQVTDVKSFIEGLKSKDPYGINCLLLSPRTSRLLSYVPKKINEALQEIPFIASFSPFLDDLHSFADVILPDTTYFEKWQDSHISQLSKIPIVGLSQPVIKPLYQSKPFEWTILSLAKKMGPNFAQNFPWTNYKDLLLSRMEGLFAAKRGDVFLPFNQENKLRILEERGWWFSQHESKDTFLKELLDKGGWLDPASHFNERSFMYQTSSRKFVFQPPLNLDQLLVPTSDSEEEFPFSLFLFDLPNSSNENGAVMPWYQENMGFRFNMMWKTWIEINPETSKSLGIKDRDPVRVESPYGKIDAVAKIFPGVAPDVVGIPSNTREVVSGQLTFDKKNSPVHLMGESFDEQTGMISRHSTRVKITKL